jgi:hypothetical protein
MKMSCKEEGNIDEQDMERRKEEPCSNMGKTVPIGRMVAVAMAHHRVTVHVYTRLTNPDI